MEFMLLLWDDLDDLLAALRHRLFDHLIKPPAT